MKLYLKRALLCFVVAYIMVCTVMYFTQRSILFHPGTQDVALDVHMVPRAQVELLQTPDDEMLKAWWVPPASDDAAVYLYLHGNAQTLARRAERLAFLAQDGAGVLALSWRGYGGSTGRPTEGGVRLDARTAYEWLVERVAAERVILFGESLGTSMAVELAAKQPSAALVLDSPFTSIADVARTSYFWLPTDLLLMERFDSISHAPDINVPVRIMHCANDPVVPYPLGVALLDAIASNDKSLLTIEGQCHVPSVAPLASTLRELEQRVKSKG